MFQWSASAQTRVATNATFVYLADPRHAGEWFASIVPESVPSGSPHLGQIWRVHGGGARGPRGGRGAEQVIRLAEFDPPRRFVWETASSRLGTALVWELMCAPATPAGTRLTLRTRWRVTALGWLPAALGAFIGRKTLPSRALRTVEHARDAVEAAFPAPRGAASDGNAGAASGHMRSSPRQRRTR